MQKLVLSIFNFYKFGLAHLNSLIDLELDGFSTNGNFSSGPPGVSEKSETLVFWS